MEAYLETLRESLLAYGPAVAAALVILVVGWFLAGAARRFSRSVLLKAGLDKTLGVFLSRLAYMLVLAFVVVAALQKLGVDTTSFAAIIAAAGLAIGLALQGSLSNFASGVLIIALRPFKVGDYIEAGGVSGSVKAVSIFATELTSADNKRIIVPNSGITSGNIVNYSAEDTRRIDLVIGIGYGDDIGRAKRVLESILEDDDRVLAEPAAKVAVGELGASSVDLVVRPWVRAENYWPARFDLTERIKLRLDEEGINIPYPQRDLHVHQVEATKPA